MAEHEKLLNKLRSCVIQETDREVLEYRNTFVNSTFWSLHKKKK